MIVGIEGFFYCFFGVMMIIFVSGDYVGMFLFGCVEVDIVLYVVDVFVDNMMCVLWYGVGLFFFDIELLCGGGFEILLILNLDVLVL